MASGGIECRQKRADLNNTIERTMHGPDCLAVVARKHAIDLQCCAMAM